MKPRDLDFSIIIPTYNRPERLEQCLQSIASLNYPTECFEVIVVDDGSQIPLTTVNTKFDEHFSLQLIRQSNTGPAHARNTGATLAQGRYLVFTDDDCQPEPDWLRVLAESTVDGANVLIGGRTINALENNLYSTASQLLIDYLYSYFNRGQSKGTFFASNNFAMPRAIFQKIGGFDVSFPLAAGEDREFCDRWQYHGYPMRYLPDMQVKHAHTLTFQSFWKQHFNYGRGAYCFHKIHGKRTNKGIKVEPFEFYLGLLSYPFSHSLSTTRIPLSLLLFISQVANTSGFFFELLT